MLPDTASMQTYWPTTPGISEGMYSFRVHEKDCSSNFISTTLVAPSPSAMIWDKDFI